MSTTIDRWGQKRGAYYDTDYVDPDFRVEDEELQMAEDEEKEALRLQRGQLEVCARFPCVGARGPLVWGGGVRFGAPPPPPPPPHTHTHTTTPSTSTTTTSTTSTTSTTTTTTIVAIATATALLLPSPMYFPGAAAVLLFPTTPTTTVVNLHLCRSLSPQGLEDEDYDLPELLAAAARKATKDGAGGKKKSKVETRTKAEVMSDFDAALDELGGDGAARERIEKVGLLLMLC
jgi:hypothetical protein